MVSRTDIEALKTQLGEDADCLSYLSLDKKVIFEDGARINLVQLILAGKRIHTLGDLAEWRLDNLNKQGFGPKSRQAFKTNVHKKGGFFQDDNIDADFLITQIKKGNAYLAQHIALQNGIYPVEIDGTKEERIRSKLSQKPLAAKVRPVKDDKRVNQKINEMVGAKVELFLMPLKDLTVNQRFAENSALYRQKDKYLLVGEVALKSQQQLIDDGVDPSEVAHIDADLRQIGFHLDMQAEAEIAAKEEESEDRKIKKKQNEFKLKFGF